MANLITIDGSSISVTPENGTDFQLDELYRLLECETIEVVTLSDEQIMIIDEEGKINDQPINQSATEIAKGSIRADDYIVGPALLCLSEELD